MARRSPPLARRWVAKEWRSACGVAVGGSPSDERRPCHRALHDARIEPAAAGADEERTRRARLLRTEAEIVGDRRGDRRQHRDDALLAALAGDAERVAGAARRLAARQPQRLGDAQPGAVEKREDRGISRRDPRLVVERLVDGRRRSAPPPARAAAARCASGAAGGWRGRRRHWHRPRARGSGSASGSRRCRGRSCANRRHPSRRAARKARMSATRSAATSATVGGPPRCVGQEDEELLDVAGIGLDRLRREPPLMGKMPPPALDRLQEIGPGKDQRCLRGDGPGHHDHQSLECLTSD